MLVYRSMCVTMHGKSGIILKHLHTYRNSPPNKGTPTRSRHHQSTRSCMHALCMHEAHTMRFTQERIDEKSESSVRHDKNSSPISEALCKARKTIELSGDALKHASALLAFWSGAICLGRGALWIFFVLSVSYVSQHCAVLVVLTYVAGSSIYIAESSVWYLQPCGLHVANPSFICTHA
jgi:hypothetical protein